METHDLVSVYSASDTITADIIRNMLEDEGIHAFIDAPNPAIFDGMFMTEIHVFVEDDRAEEARKLIEEHERQHTETEEAEDSDTTTGAEATDAPPTP